MRGRWALLLAGVFLLSTLPGHALAADWPMLEQGARGADVVALQQLLDLRGYGLTADGLFGAGTAAAVRDFQQKNGLDASGVMWSVAWTRLAPSLRRGSQGLAVQALQQELNVKLGLNLTVDGVFGAGTENAVKALQAQQGLQVDGVVGPQTWLNLLGHYQALPHTGPGWYNYRDANNGNWGTANTIARVKQVAANWSALGYGIRLGIGDISLESGQSFAGHEGHHSGREVDIRVIRNDNVEAPCAYTEPCYSESRTQELVKLLKATGDVDVIFFNDPEIPGVQPLSGHDDHLHVRFKE